MTFLGKVGVILYGLVAGTAVWFITLVVAFFVGIALRGLPCRLNWQDCSLWSVWMPMVAAKVAFYPAIAIGLFAFWRVCAPRFKQDAGGNGSST
jgi:hypothetical protein